MRSLDCSDHLKEIIHRCIGERRKRYENANELIDALQNPPASLRAGVLRSLKGVHLTFTGILRTKRTDAAAAARRAGAIVHSGPSSQTTVVVRGRPNPLQAAGRDGGLKLMEIKRLREKGHRITLLNEAAVLAARAAAIAGSTRSAAVRDRRSVAKPFYVVRRVKLLTVRRRRSSPSTQPGACAAACPFEPVGSSPGEAHASTTFYPCRPFSAGHHILHAPRGARVKPAGAPPLWYRSRCANPVLRR